LTLKEHALRAESTFVAVGPHGSHFGQEEENHHPVGKVRSRENSRSARPESHEETSMKTAKVRRFSEDRAGFTMVDLAIGLVIMGLLIGAILGSTQMMRNAKIKRQVADLEALEAVVETFVDRFSRLPGDFDADGLFDSDSAVWADFDKTDLANQARRSPFGARYYFGSQAVIDTFVHGGGNYIRISLPPYAAQRIDEQLDDGIDSTGWVTSNSAYVGSARLDLYYFID
jgi:type II secretory pathway pseudopilin PulG